MFRVLSGPPAPQTNRMNRMNRIYVQVNFQLVPGGDQKNSFRGENPLIIPHATFVSERTKKMIDHYRQIASIDQATLGDTHDKTQPYPRGAYRRVFWAHVDRRKASVIPQSMKYHRSLTHVIPPFLAPELNTFCNQEEHEERRIRLGYDHRSLLWCYLTDWYRLPRWKRLNAIWFPTFWWNFGSKSIF